VLPADGITMTGAALHASIDPSGLATTYHFEYGTGTVYQWRTADTTLSSSTAVTAVSAAVTGLGVGSDYHYRAVASNSTGTTSSADGAFTTAPYPKPVLVSVATPSAVTRTGLTVGVTVDPGGLSTSVYAEYGTDTGYGHSTATQSLGGVQALSFPLAGLAPG